MRSSYYKKSGNTDNLKYRDFNMESIIYSKTGNSSYSKFEEAYIRLRRSENRIFSDTEVLQLPYVPEQHPHYKEWKIRKQSANKLFRYIKSINKPLTILEVGCGNGWLSAYLAQISQITVTGIDINQQELNQAKKLFADKRNLRFINGSIKDIEHGNKFDVILFASSIQYFSSLQSIITQGIQLLNSNGEIHIIDTLFYQSAEVEKAKERSYLYFQSSGHNEMNRFYYHHKLEDLAPFNISILKNPLSIVNKLSITKNPFYWIRIKP